MLHLVYTLRSILSDPTAAGRVPASSARADRPAIYIAVRDRQPSVTRSLVSLVVVAVLSLGLLSACGSSSAQQGQAIAAAEGAYATAGTLETAAYEGKIPGVKLSAADVAEYKRLDTIAYNLLVTAQTNHIKGLPVPAQLLAALTQATTDLTNYLASKGIKK